MMCSVSRSGKRLVGRLTERAARTSSSDPVGLLVPSDDAQAGRREGAPDLRLAVDEDARRQEPTAAAGSAVARADRGRELRGERRRGGWPRGWRGRGRTARRPWAALPARAATRTPLRPAFWSVDSTAMGSVSMARDLAGSEQAGRDREDARSRADVEDRGATHAAPPSSQRSSPARQSLVVGCRPVPKAMPGSSATTMSPGTASWSRQVGLMTMRRPIRRTGKCSFQAVAQSSSWTTPTSRSPMGRRPKAVRWPRRMRVSATAASAARRSRAGR